MHLLVAEGRSESSPVTGSRTIHGSVPVAASESSHAISPMAFDRISIGLRWPRHPSCKKDMISTNSVRSHRVLIGLMYNQ
eukprot:759739-Hanusia_phi.AAC.1